MACRPSHQFWNPTLADCLPSIHSSSIHPSVRPSPPQVGATEVLAQLRLGYLSSLRAANPQLWQAMAEAKAERQAAQQAAMEAAVLSGTLPASLTNPTTTNAANSASAAAAATAFDPDELADNYVAKVLSSRSKMGAVLIVQAVEARQIDTVRLLLETGADPNLQNARGLTALHAACVLVPPVEGLVELLKENGAMETATNRVRIDRTDVGGGKGGGGGRGGRGGGQGGGRVWM